MPTSSHVLCLPFHPREEKLERKLKEKGQSLVLHLLASPNLQLRKASFDRVIYCVTLFHLEAAVMNLLIKKRWNDFVSHVSTAFCLLSPSCIFIDSRRAKGEEQKVHSRSRDLWFMFAVMQWRRRERRRYKVSVRVSRDILCDFSGTAAQAYSEAPAECFLCSIIYRYRTKKSFGRRRRAREQRIVRPFASALRCSDSNYAQDSLGRFFYFFIFDVGGVANTNWHRDRALETPTTTKPNSVRKWIIASHQEGREKPQSQRKTFHFFSHVPWFLGDGANSNKGALKIFMFQLEQYKFSVC